MRGTDSHEETVQCVFQGPGDSMMSIIFNGVPVRFPLVLPRHNKQGITQTSYLLDIPAV